MVSIRVSVVIRHKLQLRYACYSDFGLPVFESKPIINSLNLFLASYMKGCQRSIIFTIEGLLKCVLYKSQEPYIHKRFMRLHNQSINQHSFYYSKNNS